MKRLLTFIIISLFTVTIFGQSTFYSNIVISKTAPTLSLKGTGAIINFNNGDLLFTQSTNILTLSGGNLALGANSLTMTGSIAATGARVTKIWATDGEFTNSISINGTSIATTYAAKASPTFTGTVTLPTTTSIGAVSATEIGYVDGVTSSIQTQLNNTSELAAAIPTLTGVAIPQLSTTSINAISTPAEGLLVYDVTLHVMKFYNGTSWKTITTN
jgi:hypothetical protein